MGRTPAQKLQKRLRGVKPKKRRRNRVKLGESEISIGGRLKIIKADGTVEILPASSEFKKVGQKNYMGSEYSKPRPRKYP